MRLHKSIIFTLIAVFLLCFLSACQLLCQHQFADATCLSLQICAKCGQTEGELAEHLWQDADCTTAKTCSVCTKTDGAPLGHSWIDADCTTAKTCTVCHETDGAPLGHTPGASETVVDYVAAVEISTTTCTACGEICDTVSTTLERLHNGEEFIISYADFAKRFNTIANSLVPNCPYAVESTMKEMYYEDGTVTEYNKFYPRVHEHLHTDISSDEYWKLYLKDYQVMDIEVDEVWGGVSQWTEGHNSYFPLWNGLTFSMSDNECAKDLVTAVLMTIFPELTPESAWGIYLEACARRYQPGGLLYVRDGISLFLEIYNHTTASTYETKETYPEALKILEQCYVGIDFWILPEDHPLNVESETAFP